MRTIRAKEILAYYDGIVLFSAKDSFGRDYLGELVDERIPRYFVVQVSPQQLDEFLSGKTDLKTLMENPVGNEWFIVDADCKYGDEMALQDIARDSIPDVYWPLEGYTMP